MLNATAPIHQFMTRSLPRVTPETALSEARELMEENRLRYLPVVSRGRVVGILRARTDVVVDDFGVFTVDEGTVQGAMMAARRACRRAALFATSFTRWPMRLLPWC